MTHNRLNSRKRKITDQQYEDYWKLTLALTNFYGKQFIRTLTIIVEHINKYKLNELSTEQKVINPSVNRKTFIEDVVQYKKLIDKIRNIYPNDDETGATTRKQNNTFIKLGFIEPFFNGYPSQTLEYIKPRKTPEELKVIFSDIVYRYASFNSSATTDDTENNQVQFVVQTLLHRDIKTLSIKEIIGLALIDNPTKKYATEKEIYSNSTWADEINFIQRKYNQISYIRNVFNQLSFFTTIGKNKDFEMFLTADAKNFLPENPDTERDSYLFSLMKKAVHEESIQIYGKAVDWLTKEEQMGLVVSHIVPSAEALSKYQIDVAYDPNNALLLSPGDNDHYFDKFYITFNQNGEIIYGDNVRDAYKNKNFKNNYKLDKAILNEERSKYLLEHNRKFYQKNNL